MQPCFFTARHRNVANTATNTSEMREILCLEPTPKPLRAHPQKERRKRSVQQSVGVLRSSMRRIKSTSRTWNQVDPLVHTIVNLFADHIVVTIYLFIIGFIDAIIHSTTQRNTHNTGHKTISFLIVSYQSTSAHCTRNPPINSPAPVCNSECDHNVHLLAARWG